MSPRSEGLGRPHPGLFFLEGRALLELAACLPAYPDRLGACVHVAVELPPRQSASSSLRLDTPKCR